MRKKAAAWIAVVSLILLIIVWGVMGVEVLNDNYDIELLVYIGVACWLGLMVSLIVLRWDCWKCPHCGRIRWTNGRYCSYCGKEI